MSDIVLNVAKEFSRYPSGRYPSDSRFSGERFRDKFIIPALQKGGLVTIELDGVLGYGSSFLDVAFGSLRRDNIISNNDVGRIILKTKNRYLKAEIERFLQL